MFAGHYAASFVAKAASPQTPLWVLLLAAQFVDVLWVFAILTEVENARLNSDLASNPLDLYYMPWTHSLLATIGWAALAYLAAVRALGLASREALLVALVVVSHWFLDLVVHRPDLTLAGGDRKLGFALWNYPLTAWWLEIVLVGGSVALAINACTKSAAERRPWLWFGGGLLVLQTATSFGPLPPSILAMMPSSLAVYIIVAASGAMMEKAAQRRAG